MLKIFILFLNLFSFSLCFANTPKHLGQLVPHDWQIISYAEGDLNNDHLKDVAVLLEKFDSQEQKREIIIFFNKN